MNLGVYYFTVQKMNEAGIMYLRSLQIYERLAEANPIQFEPELAGLCMGFGVFYMDNNRQKEAILILKKGLSIQERLAEKNQVIHLKTLAYLLINLGFAYLKEGDFSNAGDCLARSQSLVPDNSWVFRNWACLFALQNDAEKSMEALKKAADLGYDDPDWIMRETALEKIRNHSTYPEIVEKIKANKEKKAKY